MLNLATYGGAPDEQIIFVQNGHFGKQACVEVSATIKKDKITSYERDERQ